MNRPKAHILIVEDDQPILRGLMDVLVFNGFQVTGADDGLEGRRLALENAFDLVILDLMLPGLDGLSICREVRRQKPGQAIVMLTAKGSEDDVVAGFKAGADDYVCKPFSLRELMVRVEAVLRRAGKNLGDQMVEYWGVTFDGRLLQAVKADQSVELTRREMDIMVYLHRRLDQIVTKRELLQDVWNYADPDIETRTVDIHMLKLRKKIGDLIPEAPFIVTVRGQGYRLET